MATYTKRIEEQDGQIIAWIDRDGFQMIRQPHHPNAFENEGWASIAEASDWADLAIVEIVANDEKQSQQAATQAALIEQAQADSLKIAEIYDAIKDIQNKIG